MKLLWELYITFAKIGARVPLAAATPCCPFSSGEIVEKKLLGHRRGPDRLLRHRPVYSRRHRREHRHLHRLSV